ncbi:unnamed protein product [Protopolystoma xenopodis]|uniref:Uncharacterized protein n=1 Tax=Protopolystoma xenopodis TaxID=117903 RepID=A0A3S5BS07_9PLAT|nr:unnamed protein product [Protopolystoma xenopodis]
MFPLSAPQPYCLSNALSSHVGSVHSLSSEEVQSFADRVDKFISAHFSVEPANHRLLLLDHEPMPRPDETSSQLRRRARLVEAVLETVGPAGVAMLPACQMALYATGRVTGLVLDSGESRTTTMGFLDGRLVPGSYRHYDFGGRDITGYLACLLHGHGFKTGKLADPSTIRRIDNTTSLQSRHRPLSNTSWHPNQPEHTYTHTHTYRLIPPIARHLTGWPEDKKKWDRLD